MSYPPLFVPLPPGGAFSHFVQEAFLGLEQPSPTAFPNLGAAWQALDIMTQQQSTPLHVQDRGNGRFSFLHPGRYTFNLVLSFEHNEVNAGRVTNLQLYNYTDVVAIGDPPLIISTGRNTPATQAYPSIAATIIEAGVGDELGLRIGNGDTYSAVIFNSAEMYIMSIGS